MSVIPPGQPIDPNKIPVLVYAALAPVPGPPVTCHVTRSARLIKLKLGRMNGIDPATVKLLYNGERVTHDDTFESLGIEDKQIREGVTFELMAEQIGGGHRGI